MNSLRVGEPLIDRALLKRVIGKIFTNEKVKSSTLSSSMRPNLSVTNTLPIGPPNMLARPFLLIFKSNI